MPAQFQVGLLLADRYEILGILGHGGTGPVYKAQDRLLDETVVIKTLTTMEAAAAGRRPLFVRSGRGVGHIHDYGQHEDVRFVSMEFVDGVDLRSAPHAPGLPVHEACAAVLQLCENAAPSEDGSASRVYELGCILYELVKARPTTPNASEVPAVLSPIIRRALVRDPRERFASLKEMAGALRAALSHLTAVDDRTVAEPRPVEAPVVEAPRADVARTRAADVEHVLATLITGLREGEAGLRWRSALALAELGPAAVAAIPALVQALDDNDPPVRQRAARALARIGPPAVTPLLAALRAAQEHVRYLAAETLTEIGAAPRPGTFGDMAAEVASEGVR